MRIHREQYLELMTFGHVERPMLAQLFGLLVGVEEEWRAQGASPAELDLSAFEFDQVEIVGCGGNLHTLGALEPVLLEETAEHRIVRDHLGRTTKLFKRTATIPLPLDFPVQNMDDWLRLKPLFVYREERVSPGMIAKARQEQADGAVVMAWLPGGFDMARELMGEEVACLAYYDQPELMVDILETLGQTAERVLSRITRELTVDVLAVHEDMAGRSGPLIGPAQVRQYIKPYYRRAWDLLASRGARLFSLDSDGNLDSILDALIESGVNEIYPNEPAAGTDMVALRKKYGSRLALSGGIDKFAIARGKEAIRRELEYKLQPLMRQGGTVFSLDHRIPNGTPLEDYRFYVDCARDMLGLPPRAARTTP